MVKNPLDEILEKRITVGGKKTVYVSDLSVDPSKNSDYYAKNGMLYKTPSSSVYKDQEIDIDEEYTLLKSLHEVDPDHTAKPYALVFRGNSQKPEGYLMEYVKGRELSDYLQDRGSRNKKADEYIFKQLESAVSAYHEHGLYHCDLYERNVMIRPDNRISIVDPLPSEYGPEMLKKIDDKDLSILKGFLLK